MKNLVKTARQKWALLGAMCALALTMPMPAFATATDVSTLTDAAVAAIQGKGAPTVTIFGAVITFVALLAVALLIVGLIKRK